MIAPDGVGRIVFTEARGPVALPVNYRMIGDSIVFRTAATSALQRALRHEQVSFEVDYVDDALAEGWSVLVSGEISLSIRLNCSGRSSQVLRHGPMESGTILAASRSARSQAAASDAAD